MDTIPDIFDICKTGFFVGTNALSILLSYLISVLCHNMASIKACSNVRNVPAPRFLFRIWNVLQD